MKLQRLQGLSKARSSNYWCTWTTQEKTLARHQLTGELKFPGDQGVPGVRDNLNEDVIFGPNGWINLFPGYRQDLIFMADDVAVGVFGEFGSLVLDDRTESRRVVACDILGGEAVDITAKCVRTAGRIALPGDQLAQIGAAQNPPEDDSAPGVVIRVV